MSQTYANIEFIFHQPHSFVTKFYFSKNSHKKSLRSIFVATPLDDMECVLNGRANLIRARAEFPPLSGAHEVVEKLLWLREDPKAEFAERDFYLLIRLLFMLCNGSVVPISSRYFWGDRLSPGSSLQNESSRQG